MEKVKQKQKYEITALTPGWIKKELVDPTSIKIVNELFMFYVINTPCDNISACGLPMSHYGWNKDVWKKGELRRILFGVAGLETNKTFFVAHKTDEMKAVFQKADLRKGFQTKRDIERIAIYKEKCCEFLSLCYHIRNAFAHGRFAIYPLSIEKDVVFVLEDGKKMNGELQVRARMVLKGSTLKRWIELIRSGKLPQEKQEI